MAVIGERPIDPILTQIGMEYRQAEDAYAAEALFPWVRTDQETGTYYIASPLQNLRAETGEWSDNAGAKREELQFTSGAFSARGYAFEVGISRRAQNRWLAGGQDLLARAARSREDKLLLAREVRVEALADAVAPTVSLSSTAKWNSTASDPRAVVNAGSDAIRKRIGRGANSMIITGSVWSNMTGTVSAGTAGAVILDAVKYTEKAMGNILTPALMAQYFNLLVVKPAQAIQQATTAYETTTIPAAGLPQDGTYIWDKDELYITYTDPNPSPQTVSYGVTLGPTMGEVDTYYEDRTKSDFVRAVDILAEEVTCSNAIYVVGTVL